MRRSNPFQQLRTGRMRALAEGTAAPVAFFWDDPELLTVDSGDVFEIHFNDMIDDWYGISSAMIVEALIAADGRDVLVHLNSPGGMVTEGLSIRSQFKQYGGKITMRVEGMAASAASFVMLAGDDVEIEPEALVMIHDAWDITVGGPAEHRKALDLLEKISDSTAGMYAEKAGGTVADWRAAMIEETWYVGQDAVDAGLVDRLVGAEQASDTAAASRWSGIFASAPKRTSGKISVTPAALVDTDALVRELAKRPRDSARAQPLPAHVGADRPSAGEPVPNNDEVPEWWATLHNGMKGVRK